VHNERWLKYQVDCEGLAAVVQNTCYRAWPQFSQPVDIIETNLP